MTEDIFSKKNCFLEWAHVKSNLLVGNYEDCPNPRVSIIMPCYKRADYFKLSLQSAVNQDYDFEYEIVVVDNNVEGDKSPNQSIVEECGAKNVFYYRNAENLGMAGNWNRGIELARAEYITYCHDDDLLLPSCLSTLMEIQKYTKDKCILSAHNIIDENGKYRTKIEYPHRKRRMHYMVEKPYYNYTLYDQFLSSNGFGVGCLFNRNHMLELGGYNKEFYPSFDYALQSAYTYYYGCIYNAIPSFNYRLGINESNSAWVGFNNADKHFRKCMIPKIHIPNFILSRIADALFNRNEIEFRRSWGNEKVYEKISKRDSWVLKIATFYSQRIKPYYVKF